MSAVFALKIDRLGRSSHALGRLWAVCKDSRARVITTEGDFTDDDPATFLMRHTFEGFAVYYLKDQKLKSKVLGKAVFHFGETSDFYQSYMSDFHTSEFHVEDNWIVQ